MKRIPSRLQHHLRLEELGPWTTRGVIGCTYLAVIAAACITVLLHIGWADEILLLSGVTPCPSLLQSPTAAGSGCLEPIGPPARNSTRWNGQLTGLSQLDGEVALFLHALEPLRSEIDTTFIYDAELDGSADGVAWQRVLSLYNASADLYCKPAPPSSSGTDAYRRSSVSVAAPSGTLHQPSAPLPSLCDPILLFDTASVTDGQGAGGWATYKAVVTYHNFNISQWARNATVVAQYQSGGYRAADTTTRIICLVMVIVVLGWWLTVMCRQRGWLVQQRWVTALLISILLWLNPIFIVTEPLPSTDINLSPSATAVLRLITVVLQCLGWAALFTFWLMMAEAASVPGATLQALSLARMLSIPRRRIRKKESTFQKMCNSCSGLLCACCRCGSSHVDGVPVYPSSGCRFYAPKVLLFLALLLVSSGLQVLARPAILTQALSGATSSVISGQATVTAVVVLSILYLLLVIVWAACFFAALYRSGAQLKLLPYAPTRYYQLAYRFFLFQYLIVVLFVLAVNLLPVISFFVAAAQHPLQSTPDGPDRSEDDVVASLEAQAASIVQTAVQPWSGAGEVILVTTYGIIMAYCYAPPVSKQHAAPPAVDGDGDTVGAGDSGGQRLLHEVARIVTAPATIAAQAGQALTHDVRAVLERALGITNADEHAFSLSLACAMFDFANAAYFDPQGGLYTTPSSFGPIPCPPHGFQLEGVSYSPQTDTFAVVSRLHHRVVLAFRGTCSQANLKSDLNFAWGKVRFDDHGDPDAPSDQQQAAGRDANRPAAGTSLAGRTPGIRLALPSVHTGFWNAYASVRAEVAAIVRSALAAAGPAGRLYITGHSLGGALACLAAADLQGLVKANRKAFAAVHGARALSHSPVRLVPRVSGGRQYGPQPNFDRDGASRLSAASARGGLRAESKPAAEVNDAVGPLQRFASSLASTAAADDAGDGNARSLHRPLLAAASAGDAAERALLLSPQHGPPPSSRSASGSTVSESGSGAADSSSDGVSVSDQLLDPDQLGNGGSDPLDCIGFPPGMEAWDDDDGDDQGTGAEHDGGSFALTAATNGRQHDGQQQQHTDVTLVTFGAPRVGNAIFAALANRRVPRAFRLVHDGDLVTGIPSLLGLYKHCGIEVWLDPLGNTIVAPSFVEKQFRASARTSVFAHRMSAYRRGLLFARRNEGLPQFHAWATSRLHPV